MMRECSFHIHSKSRLMEAGFTLLNLYEDTNGEGRLHDLNIPTFLAMRSKKM